MRSRPLRVRLLLILCVLASALQGFIAQTHVHTERVASVVAASKAVDALPGPESTCLLCDIAGHTPAVVPPVAVAAVDCAEPARAQIAVITAAPFASNPGHHWLGRGPPPV